LESRRSFLQWVVYSAIGTGLFLATGNLTKVASTSLSEQRSTIFANATSTPDLFISVKVVYIQMAQYISTSEEYFVLPNPATVQDLLGNMVQRHPLISSMMRSMWVMINGAPSRLDDFLKDGDEVDFLPLVTGG